MMGPRMDRDKADRILELLEDIRDMVDGNSGDVTPLPVFDKGPLSYSIEGGGLSSIDVTYIDKLRTFTADAPLVVYIDVELDSMVDAVVIRHRQSDGEVVSRRYEADWKRAA